MTLATLAAVLPLALADSRFAEEEEESPSEERGLTSSPLCFVDPLRDADDDDEEGVEVGGGAAAAAEATPEPKVA